MRRLMRHTPPLPHPLMRHMPPLPHPLMRHTPPLPHPLMRHTPPLPHPLMRHMPPVPHPLMRHTPPCPYFHCDTEPLHLEGGNAGGSLACLRLHRLLRRHRPRPHLIQAALQALDFALRPFLREGRAGVSLSLSLTHSLSYGSL